MSGKTPQRKTSKLGRPEGPRGPQGSRIRDGSPQARLRAAAVLEVLAGVRTPVEAAEAIGVTPNRYYGLESRALEGLLEACESRSVGPRVSPEREQDRLKSQIRRLERELGRYQALARAAARAAGLTTTKRPKETAARGSRRKRRPTVRALQASKRLQSASEPEGIGTESPPSSGKAAAGV